MLKIIYLMTCAFLLYSCSSGGNHQKNKERLKQVYGECDNPFEPLSRRMHKECKAKERAKGESLFGLTKDFNKLLGNNNSNIIYQNNVNPYLWNAALDVTDIYALKIADNQGGYKETDWIYDKNKKNKIC